MTNTENKSYTPSRTEQGLLAISAVIMGSIILFVWIRTEMLLWGYTIVHVLLTVAVLSVLAFGSRHKLLTRIVTVLAVVGAVSAIVILTLLYRLSGQS
jgi:hypothetical protein